MQYHRRIEPVDLKMNSTKLINRKLVAWIVSHCKTNSKREEHVRELQKHIPVDIYGKCEPLNCTAKNKMSNQCYQIIETRYKFYLSFENSMCLDYITEKALNILKLNVVPIVRGPKGYNKHVPPNSVINAREFASPKSLAEFIKELDKDHNRYMGYLKWKAHYYIGSTWEGRITSLCHLCSIVHNQTFIHKSRSFDFKSWYSKNNTCTP